MAAIGEMTLEDAAREAAGNWKRGRALSGIGTRDR